MNKLQLGVMKNNIYNARVCISGMCDSLVNRINEWQKGDAGCWTGLYKDSKGYAHLESALISLREAERELINSTNSIEQEIEHYGES